MGPLRLHVLVAALATSLVLMSSGCGPGVGGTGTGEGLAAFGAAAAPVCDSAFADKLVCIPVTPGASPSGSQSVRYVDATRQLVLKIDANQATLDALCQRVQFSGDFGIAPGNASGFFGTYQVSPSTAQTFAHLLVQRLDAGGDLRIELRDIDGRSVVAPVTLLVAPTPLPAPAPC
jgi:hypothetical protein